MWALLDNWVSTKMELPGLLAPILNGAAACVFWMTLHFYHYFQAARMQQKQGLPPMPCMTKLMEQLRLHVFTEMAPPLSTCYLPAGRLGQLGPRATNDNSPNQGTRVQNPHPYTAFCAYDKAGQLGPAITKHLAPTQRGNPCASHTTCVIRATATAQEPPITTLTVQLKTTSSWCGQR